MSKEITKAYILQQMEDKLKLRELTPEVFRFSEEVVPVYNIEQHLASWEVLTNTVSITSATHFSFFDVPENERWLLRSYMVIYGMTGAHQGSGFYIDGRPKGGDWIYLDLKAGQDVSYLVNLPVPVVLDSKNKLNYLIDSYTSTQDLIISIDVRKEEIR